MKKLLMFLFGVIVLVVIAMAGFFLNFKSDMEAYKYIPKDVMNIVSMNPNAKNAAKLLKIEGKEWQLKTVKRMYMIINKNIDKTFTETDDKLKFLDVMIVQSRLKKVVLDMISKKMKSDDVKQRILPNGDYELTLKKLGDSKLYIRYIDGNLIVARSEERIDEVVKNASEKNVEEIKDVLDSNRDKIISVMLNFDNSIAAKINPNVTKMFKMIITNICFDKGFLDLEGALKLKEDGKQQIANFLKVENKDMEKTENIYIKKNKIYLKVKPEFALYVKMFLPNIAVNEPTEKTGEKVELKGNQFMYSYIVPREGVVEKVNGYIESDTIMIEFLLDEKTVFNIKNKNDGIKLLNETQKALGF